MRRPGGGPAKVIIELAAVATLTLIGGLAAELLLDAARAALVWPVLASVAIFVSFSRILSSRTGVHLFGELGFVYLSIALAYTISPATKLILMDFNVPLTYDGTGSAVLPPTPREIAIHFWRLALFVAGVAAGFLAVRTRRMPEAASPAPSPARTTLTIATLLVLIASCISLEVYLSQEAGIYVDYYTRFDHLPGTWRRMAQAALVLKGGGYFTLLVLLFTRYRSRRGLIYGLAALVCTYEIIHSLGARIEAFSLLLAVFGLYHFQVRAISLKKGAALVVGAAVVFYAVEVLRSSNLNPRETLQQEMDRGILRGSELDSVFASSFQVYQERAQETLPPRDWRMFFWEFISVTPFVDHLTYHPHYWFARNYFPGAVVPPTTLGVVAQSGLWGGELDLLARSLFNGAIFAWLTRWFLRRRGQWWAQTVYFYCYATCVLTLKYSVLYQIIPLLQIVLPGVLIAGALLRAEARFGLRLGPAALTEGERQGLARDART